MERFTRLEASYAALPSANIDTDQIIPARFLQKPRAGGLARYLFHDLRFRPDGSEDPAFPLHHPGAREARILIGGPNFGCGSSRENAVWALHDYGFRAVIAPGFGDIFFNNCLKNGLLPVVLPLDVVATLLAHPGETLTVDLAAQTVATPAGTAHPFELDPFARHCLLNGMDELDYTLSRMSEILEFERRYES